MSSWVLMNDSNERMGIATKGWINVDESGKEMLSRVLMERPCFLLPPLHRLPLRVGNVVELVGPSPSAKTHILMEVFFYVLYLFFHLFIFYFVFYLHLHFCRLQSVAFFQKSGMGCSMEDWGI